MGFPASSLTCTVDGLAHLVSDDAAAAGIAAGRGTYLALCGHTVRVAALVSSNGRPCSRCVRIVEAEEPGPLPTRRRRRFRFTGPARRYRTSARVDRDVSR